MCKKICSVILALCMCTAAVCLPMGAGGVSAAEESGTAKQDLAVSLVTGLEIMSFDSQADFEEQTLVKRGEFALYAARLLGYDVKTNSAGSGYFSDVDMETLEGAAAEILAAAQIIPKSSRQFNPNSEITYIEAVRMILNGLGYKNPALLTGGFPDGYISFAAECKLNRNLHVSANTNLTKADAVVLLYNALFVNPMEFNGTKYTKSKQTYLEKMWDVYEISGIVNGYEKTFLGSGKTLRDNYVDIGGKVYDAGTTNIGNYVGYFVRAYCKKENGDTDTLVAFSSKQSANKVTTLLAEDIEVEGNTVYYYTDTAARRKSLSVSESASVLYNGRYYAEYKNLEELLNIPEGEITFITNNSSGAANVVIISEYKHLLVEHVDKRGERLYLKNGSVSATSVPYLDEVISVASEEDGGLTVYIAGEKADFDDILENDAISMKQSRDKEETVLYVSRETISGKITTISGDDKVEIDGKEYTVSKYSTSKYAVGATGTYAVTADGKLLGLAGTTRSEDNNYGYILKTGLNDGLERAYVKLYTAQGEVKVYECDSKIRINDERKKYDKIPDAVLKSEIVTYTANSEGKLTRINRAYDASSVMNYVNETEFVKNWNKSSVRYTDGIMGMSLLTDDTVIFSMPRFDRDKDADYKVLKLSDLKNRTYADVTCYDIDRQGRAGAVLIVEDVSDSVSMGNSLFFVKEAGMSVNDDNEIVSFIDGYENGEEKRLVFTDDTTSVTYEDGWMNYVGNEDFDKGYGSLNVGDAIQYSLDNEGNVGAYRLVYNNDKTIFDASGNLKSDWSDSYYEDWSGTGSVTKQDFYDDLYISFGDVQARYLNYILHLGLNMRDRLAYENSNSKIQIIDYYRPINLTKAPIYVYNVNKRELELGSVEDVAKGDAIFVRSKKMGELNEVMVYVEN